MPSWKRLYWSVWLANLITSVGMMSFLPFFPTHLRELGLEDRASIAGWSGAIFGAAPLMAALMGPVWGSLGDRFGRKAMVLRAQLAIGFFIGCMAFARSPEQLLALRLLQGVFSGFVAPSITLVSVHAPRGIQGRVAGSLQTALALGTIAGPLLGALVQADLGLRALFLCVSGAALASALIVVVLAREAPVAPRPAGERRGPLAELARVGADLASHATSRELRGVFWIVFAAQFAVGGTQPLLELHVDDLLGGADADGPRLTALLFSVVAGMDLVAMPLWGRLGDRRGHRAMLLRSTALTGGALLLHAAAPAYAWLLAARVLLGAAYSGVRPCAFGLTAEHTPVERRGSAVGLVLSARQLAISSSAVAGGLLAGAVGLRGLFAASGVGLVALVALLARRAREQEPAAARAAADR